MLYLLEFNAIIIKKEPTIWELSKKLEIRYKLIDEDVAVIIFDDDVGVLEVGNLPNFDFYLPNKYFLDVFEISSIPKL